MTTECPQTNRLEASRVSIVAYDAFLPVLDHNGNHVERPPKKGEWAKAPFGGEYFEVNYDDSRESRKIYRKVQTSTAVRWADPPPKKYTVKDCWGTFLVEYFQPELGRPIANSTSTRSGAAALANELNRLHDECERLKLRLAEIGPAPSKG